MKRGATGGQVESGRVTRTSCGWKADDERKQCERKQCVAQKAIGRTTSHRTTVLHVHDGQLRVHSGWAIGSEERGRGRREKRGEKQARQTLLGGQAGRDAHPSTQQKQEIPPVPPPPFTSPNFALERRRSELATRDVVVVHKKLLLVDEKYFDQSIFS